MNVGDVSDCGCWLRMGNGWVGWGGREGGCTNFEEC